MATLQVKGMDNALYKALGARAALDNRSVSQEVVSMIKQFLGKPQTDAKGVTEALLELAGSWEDDRSASEIARDIRKTRRNKGRFGADEDVFA